MNITIRDIARKCKVSKSTVSRVLHDDENVKDDTRKKVLTAIDKLRYNPLQNFPLASQVSTKALGLVLPSDVDDTTPFFHRAFTQFRKVTRENGYECTFYTTADLNKKINSNRMQEQQSINSNALIFFCPHGEWDTLLKELKERGIPCVLIRRQTKVPGIPVITDDDYEGGMLAYEYLYASGHTRIAIAEGGGGQYMMGKTNAFTDFLVKHRLPDDKALRWDEVKQQEYSVEAWVHTLVGNDNKPTAIACCSDTVAIQVIKALKQEGFRVPEDMAVIGYDNDYTAELFSPGITTVNIPINEMVSQACKLAIDLINGEQVGNVEMKFKNQLVVRESCSTKAIPSP
jgi:DNA-binding LacI/PurR family transcriptional regulator